MVLLPLLLSLTAGAADCKAIIGGLKDASPNDSARLFVELAACDASAARKAAPAVIPGLLGDEGGRNATLVAIKVGASVPARAWIHGLQSDERAPMLRDLGLACTADNAVAAFLVETATVLEEDFWAQRWYRSLVECRRPEVQQVLTNHVATAVDGEERERYFAVVSAWAGNLAGEAVPKLERMIAETKDTEAQVRFVQAFTDAAQVGSVKGTDEKVAEAAAEAIMRLSVDLPHKAVDQARITLNALGDEQGADALAKVRFNDLLQEDNSLLYGVVAVETVSCKNGKVKQQVHVAEVTDPGQTWPDQLEDKVNTVIRHHWKLNLAQRCGGEGEPKLHLPTTPFKDEAEFKVWVTAQIKEAKHTDVKKPSRKNYDPIEL